MDKDIIIETDRLILRQWNLEDVNDVVEGVNIDGERTRK